MTKPKRKGDTVTTTEVANASKASKLPAPPTGAWGKSESNQDDLILPKLLVVQPTSKINNNQELNARPGEIRNSVTGELEAALGKPIEFVPFYVDDTWVHSEKKNGKWEFVGIEPRTNPTEYEYYNHEDGEQATLKHEKAINVYCLLPAKLAKGPTLPNVLTFKGAKTFQAGRKLKTMLKELEMLGLPIAHRIFSVQTEQVTNDKGTFYVLSVSQGDVTPAKFQAAAYDWFTKKTAGSVKVDESEEA